MFNPELRNVELPKIDLVEGLMGLSSQELKSKLMEILGSSNIDTGELKDIQEFRLDGGRIITVNFRLREHKNINEKNSTITVNVENGPESFETNWEGLDIQDRYTILKAMVANKK